MNEISELRKSLPALNDTLVEVYNKCQLITDKEINNLVEARQFIAETFSSVPMYRPLAVKLLGVLSSKEHPSDESKLWQCKVEAEVHANELVRDMHELEKMRIDIERNDFILNTKLGKALEQAEDEIVKAEIGFDARKLSVIISQQKFEMLQLQKRIKYRIEEIHEWKIISQKLEESGTKTSSYSEMIVKNLRARWEHDLADPKVSEEDKKSTRSKLNLLEQSFRSR